MYGEGEDSGHGNRNTINQEDEGIIETVSVQVVIGRGRGGPNERTNGDSDQAE